MDKLGALAAFGTALCWSFSAIFFENATRRVGALAVNFWKVAFAFVLLTFAGLATRGMPFPFDASSKTWTYLGLSSLVGFLIADYFLFNAYLLIGSRITIVFQAITPVFTALFALVFLGETMRPERLVGMAIVILGIVVVVISRQRGVAKTNPVDLSVSKKGYLFAFLSSIFQAGGLIFSKLGLGGYSAISGTQIRIFFAILLFGAQALLTGQKRHVFELALKERKVMRFMVLGAIFGPFLGVTLSLFALQNTTAGTASTLMAMNPILIIPLSILILKQKVRPMEILGAIVAVSGAALFFLL
jgi:drug/metabolite transporter (DMT)-like permease